MNVNDDSVLLPVDTMIGTDLPFHYYTAKKRISRESTCQQIVNDTLKGEIESMGVCDFARMRLYG